MKKKLLFAVAMIAMLACLFAISASAATPDTSKETVTLSDGTVCPIWDTDGNGLIWYITSDGSYAYVSSTDASVDYKNTWNGGNQLSQGAITITAADGATYGTSSMVVVNIKNGVKITSGQLVGNYIDRFTSTFYNCANLEYVYLPLGTKVFGGSDFKSCPKMKFVNVEELTELTQIGGQTFNCGSQFFAGRGMDLSNTKVTSIGDGAFSYAGMTSLKLPATLTSVGQWAFQYCRQVEEIDFNNANLTYCNTYCLFQYCNALETIKGFTAFTSGLVKNISSSAFRECKVLYNVTGLIENGVLTFPNDCTTVNSQSFRDCKAITNVKFSPNLATINAEAFYQCTGIVFMEFASSNVSIPNHKTFYGCTSLLAVSLPSGITALNDATFAGCTALKAVYLGESMVNINGNKADTTSDGPTFGACKNMYLVQSPFTTLKADGTFYTAEEFVMPEKPLVYFFPSTLKRICGAHNHNANHSMDENGHVSSTSSDDLAFVGCTNLNTYLVFPDGFTGFDDISNSNNEAQRGDTLPRGMMHNCATAENPITLVFLGRIDRVSMDRRGQTNYMTYMFANSANTGFENTLIGSYTSDADKYSGAKEMYVVFCHAKDGAQKYSISFVKSDENKPVTVPTAVEGTTHAANPLLAQVQTPATCVTNAFGVNSCFCGADMGENEIMGTALGHSHTVDLGIYYVNYMSASYYSIGCERCDDVKQGEEAIGAIFTYYGYSCTEEAIDGKYSMSQFYGINADSLNAYTAYTGKSFEYGLVASGAANPLSYVDGELVVAPKAFIKDSNTFAHDFFAIKINGMIEDNLNTAIVFCAYVVDGDRVVYLDNDATTKVVTGSTYNDVLASLKEEE